MDETNDTFRDEHDINTTVEEKVTFPCESKKVRLL